MTQGLNKIPRLRLTPLLTSSSLPVPSRMPAPGPINTWHGSSDKRTPQRFRPQLAASPLTEHTPIVRPAGASRNPLTSTIQLMPPPTSTQLRTLMEQGSLIVPAGDTCRNISPSSRPPLSHFCTQLFSPLHLIFTSRLYYNDFCCYRYHMRPWSNGYDAGLRSLRSRFDSWRARHTLQRLSSWAEPLVCTACLTLVLNFVDRSSIIIRQKEDST